MFILDGDFDGAILRAFLSPFISTVLPSMPFHETEKLIVPCSANAVSVNDTCAFFFRPSSDT